MKVSKTSWHYRFIKRVWFNGHDYNIATNLCPYMRQLVYASLKALVLGSMALVTLVLVLICLGSVPVGLWHWLTYGTLPLWATDNKSFWSIAWMFGTVVWGSVLVVGGSALVVSLLEGPFYRWMERRRNITKKEPGLLGSWFKDWHDKTCTPIEFEDPTP